MITLRQNPTVRFGYRAVRFASVVGLLVLGSQPTHASDWPTYQHDNHRSGVTDEAIDVSRLEVAWKWRSPVVPQPAWYGPAKWDAFAGLRGLRGMRNYDPVFHPIVVGGRVYFGSSADDILRCLDLRTGKIVWDFQADGPIRIAPTAWQKKIYFGSDDGYAYGVDANDGTIIWKTCPSGATHRVIGNGRFISFWPCRSGVTIEDGIAYFSASLFPWKESYLCAVDANTGSADVPGGFIRSWKQETFEGPLAVSQNRLISPRGRVAPKLFRRSDGSPLGELPEGGGSFVVVTDQQQVLHGPGNKAGWLVSSNAQTRQRIATYKNGNAMVIDGSVAYLLTDTQLIASDFDSRENRWVVNCDFPHALILAGTTLIAGGQDGVAGFSAEDGRRLWHHEVDGKVFSLAVADGRLVVSTDTGAVYAFGEGNGQVAVAKRTASRESPVGASPRGMNPRKQRVAPPERIADQSILGRWVFQQGTVRGRIVRDLIGSHHAQIQGPVEFSRSGDIEALILDGQRNSVLVHEDFHRAQLPTEAFSVEAWIRIDKPLVWGGIIGAFQDNGSFEKGWVLGYSNSKFYLALNGVEGPDRLTYLTAPTDFELEHWYYVAGTYDGNTMTLYVNGREAAQSTVQSGAIQYPPEAYYEIGAYHDKDEYFRLQGMLHEVRISGRVLSPREIQRYATARPIANANPSRPAIGPWLQFINAETAIVRWHTEEPSPTVLEYGSGKTAKTVREMNLKKDHEVRLEGLKHKRSITYAIKHAVDGQLRASPLYECDNFFNFTLPDLSDRNWAGTSDSVTFDQLCKSTARSIIQASGIRRGICLVYGCVNGRLAYELARHSRLNVVIVDTDESRIRTVRRSLYESQLSGPRINAYHIPAWDHVPFSDKVANLIVSERLLNEPSFHGDPNEVCRLLRPYGGTAVLGHPDSSAVSRESLEAWHVDGALEAKPLTDQVGTWTQITRKTTAQHGRWTHLYGSPDNSSFAGETLDGVRNAGDLEVQWVGRPGPRYQADRNGRKPSPLAANGRLILQGLHRIVALDAYNGSILWSLEIPDFERFNMPRDCSNWCMDDEYLYAAIRDRCWKIRASDGAVVDFIEPVAGDREGWNWDWGYVANADDTLYGSAVKSGSSFTNFWGNASAGWYDAQTGIVTAKICAENLFAMDKSTGNVKWQYTGGLVVHPTITLSETTAYFVECRNADERAKNTRRLEGVEFWKDLFLVAVDLRTGEKQWEKPLAIQPGSVVFYMAYGSQRLAIVGSSAGKYHTYVFRAEDGERVWQDASPWLNNKGDHGHHMSRPAIAEGRLYVRPAVFDLKTGKKLDLTLPAGGCGTYACTKHLVIYRSGTVNLWDASNGQTSTWARLRPDCWLSTIPACGMLLSPEGGGGCSCGNWLETSIGFLPK